LPDVLFGCATWAVTFREKHKFKIFENGVLGKIFVPRREDVTGDRRKLHVGELHDLYSTPNRPYQPSNKIKKRISIMWCVGWGGSRNVYSCLVGTAR
jgi:hypothetical protein